jgi:Xaa-Pro aminopeptidase
MARHSPPVDAYIVPSDDPHLSEYTHPHYQRRQHLTGFSGSAGTALVTPQGAKLWTDSRYYEQAEKELPEGVGLMRSGLPGTPTIAKYLEKYLESEGEPLRVGIDPELHSSSFVKALEKALPLPPVFTKGNLLDESWAERPPPPTSQVS